MSAANRKGQSGEREIAALVHNLTGWQMRRRLRQQDGDSNFDGVPGWLIGVRRATAAGRADVARWWLQTGALARQEVKLPVLFYRADRDEWRAVWPLAAHLRTQSIERWSEYAWAVDGSPKAWAAAAREFAMPQDPKTNTNERRG